MKGFVLISESLATGFVLGCVFAFMRLPVPAPNVLAGAVGVVGVTLGAILIHHIR